MFALRLFATGDEDDAREVARAVLASLGLNNDERTATRLRPYWKLDGVFEVFLVAPSSLADSCLSLGARIADGWEEISGNVVVWNAGKGRAFCDSRVIWAEVEWVEQ